MVNECLDWNGSFVLVGAVGNIPGTYEGVHRVGDVRDSHPVLDIIAGHGQPEEWQRVGLGHNHRRCDIDRPVIRVGQGLAVGLTRYDGDISDTGDIRRSHFVLGSPGTG